MKWGQVLLAAPWGGAFILKKAGLYLVGLWPLSEYVTAWESPLWYGRSGFYVVASPGGDGALSRPLELACQRYDSLRNPTASGPNVEDGGRLLLEARTPARALDVARTLQALRAAPEDERPRVLKALLIEAADVDAVRARRQQHVRHAPWVKALAATLFAGVFIALPLALFAGAPDGPGAGALLVALAAVHVCILVLAYQTLKAGGVGSTAAVLLPMVFFPPAAIHALSTIGRELYARFDPMAVSAVLMDPVSFTSAARKEGSRLAVARERAPEDLTAYWRLRESLLVDLVSRTGGDPGTLRLPPARSDADAAAYCPLCFSEYRAGFDNCAECEVGLKAYS